jgi:hypothetical protein
VSRLANVVSVARSGMPAVILLIIRRGANACSVSQICTTSLAVNPRRMLLEGLSLYDVSDSAAVSSAVSFGAWVATPLSVREGACAVRASHGMFSFVDSSNE